MALSVPRQVTLFALAACWLPALLSGCIGDLKTEEEAQAQLAKIAAADVKVSDGELSDVAATDGAQADAAKDDAVAGDTGKKEDLYVAPECITDDDCEGKVLGKTACKPLVCSAGKCELGLLEMGTPCQHKGVLGECEQATCDDAGVCAKVSRAEGTTCGPYFCGKKCEAGECVAAVASDYEDGNPCTKDFCKDGAVVEHEPITDLNLSCDDGDPCTDKTICFKGECKGEEVKCDNGIACAVGFCKTGVGCEFAGNDTLCDDGDPCTKETCDESSGCAVTGYAAATVTCDDANPCTGDDHCADEGACAGKLICGCQTDADCAAKSDNLCLGDQVCADGVCAVDPAQKVTCDDALDTTCLTNACETTTGKCGLTPTGQDNPCDDGNACTDKSTCQEDGTCTGPAEVKCDDKNPCTDDACDPLQGCVFEPNGAPCEDGDACTSGDGCAAGGCVGKQKVCDDAIPCTTNGCDAKTGACAYTPKNETCDDGNPCTKDVCDPKSGCAKSADDAAKCDDGDGCTADSCSGGSCLAKYICDCKADGDCNDNNPCTNDSCNAGKCSSAAVGDDAKKPCDTGDLCEIADSGVCLGGQCQSTGKKKDCGDIGDACNVGACDQQTGDCVKSPKGDGTACDADDSGCTEGDQCKGGLCQAGPKADCSKASGPCAVGTCKSSSPTSHTCVAVSKPKGTDCEDGLFCTVLDTCDAQGKCGAGGLRTCAEKKDACNFGKCLEETDQCGKTPKPASVQCDDGQHCTVKDHCSGGECVGGGARVCPPGAVCTVGNCDEGGDKCLVANAAAGAACEDGSKCTSKDTCDGKGTCTSGPVAACSTAVKCMAAFCDAATGACQTKPTKAGTACDDGEPCTNGDTCDGGGKCTAGGWNFSDAKCQCQSNDNCDDKNVCTEDACVNKECVFEIKDGDVCDDGNACTTESKCSKAAQCVGTKFFACAGNQCNEGYCVQESNKAVCKFKPLAVGTKCDDKLWCTEKDQCNAAGQCSKTTPRNCGDDVACTTDVCNELTDHCDNASTCDDNDACTNDKCDKGSGKCQYTSAIDCSDGNSCTLDSCEKGQCVNDGLTGGPCSDGNPCSLSDTCNAGVCSGVAKTCNDGNICTSDACVPDKGGCVFKKVSDKPCNDGKPCTVNDSCDDGKCAGVERTCDDHDKCTTDTCLLLAGAAGKCHWSKTSYSKCERAFCKQAQDCPSSTDPCLVPWCAVHSYRDDKTGVCKYKESCLAGTIGGGG